jgi:hypothetical protein
MYHMCLLSTLNGNSNLSCMLIHSLHWSLFSTKLVVAHCSTKAEPPNCYLWLSLPRKVYAPQCVT